MAYDWNTILGGGGQPQQAKPQNYYTGLDWGSIFTGKQNKANEEYNARVRKREELQRWFEENVREGNRLREEAAKMERSPLVVANKFKDAVIGQVTAPVKLGEDIANKQWNWNNTGENIVDLAKNANRGKYGIATAIAASPVAAPTELLGSGYQAVKANVQQGENRKLQENTRRAIENARRLRDQGKLSNEQFSSLLQRWNTADNNITSQQPELPTTKQVLGQAAMTIAEALAAYKVLRAVDTTKDIANSSKAINATSTTGNVIKDLKSARSAAETVAATKLTGKEILKSMGKQGLKAGAIGAIGAGGISAADNASNEDIVKNTAVGFTGGTILGSGASGIAGLATNKIANRAQSKADRLGITIQEVQEMFNNNKTRKRIAGALVKQGNLDEARLVLKGEFDKSQLQEITDVLNKDNRQMVQGPDITTPAQNISYGSRITSGRVGADIVSPENPTLALPEPTRQGLVSGTDVERGYKPGRVKSGYGTPEFVTKDTNGNIIQGPAPTVETSQGITPVSKVTENNYPTAKTGPQYGTGSTPEVRPFRTETTVDRYVIPGKEVQVPTGKQQFTMIKSSYDLKNIVDKIHQSNIEAGVNNTKWVEDLVNFHKTNNSKFTEFVGKIPGLNKAARLLEGRNTVIRNFGEAGKEFAARTDVQELLKEQYRGQVENLLTEIRKSGGKNYKETLDNAIAEIKAATTPEARANLQGVAKQIADLQDIRRTELINAGVDVGMQEGYFTDMIKPGMEEEAREYIKGVLTNKLNTAVRSGDEATLQAYGLTKGATAADIKDAVLRDVDGSITNLEMLQKKKGQMKSGVEYTKTHLLPERFYEKDPEIILSSWNDGTSKRLAASQVFGRSDEVADTLMNRIRDEYGEKAQKLTMDMLQKQRYGTPTNAATPFLRNVRSYNMLRTMGLSAITNAGQVSNKYTMFGASKTLSAYAEVTKNWSKYVKIANERGIGLTELTDSLMETVYSKGKKNLLTTASGKVLDWNGFKTVETMHRLADIKLSDDIMAQMEKKGLDSKFTKNWMRRLGLNADEIATQGLNEANKKAITRQVVASVDFYVDPKDIASWTTSGEAGKTISQLGKFALKQGGHIGKQVVNEAAHGNLAPALRWLVGTQVVGAGVVAGKNAITGRKRENSLKDAINSLSEALQELEGGNYAGAWDKSGRARQYAGENIARAGGLGYAYDLVQGLDYGTTPQEKILNALGPTGSMVNSGLKAGQAAVEGDTEKAIREGSKLLPFQNIWSANYDRATGGNTFTFDPRGGAPYDLNDKLPKSEQLKVSRGDADAFGKATRNGTVANTAVVEQIAKKLYDYKGNENLLKPEVKNALNKFLQDNGVTNARDIALASYKKSYDRSKELGKANDGLSDKEKAVLKKYGSSAKAQDYLQSVGDSIDNYPALKKYFEIKERVNFSAKPAEIKSAVTGMLSDLSEQNKQEKLPPNTLVGNFILGLKTIFGQGPKDYEDKPTVVYEKNTGQNYGGLYYGDKDLIKIVKQDGPYAKEMENSVLTHENAHADYQKMRNSNLFPTGLAPRDEQFVDNKFVETLMKEQPDAYEYIMKVLKESGTYGKNGENADVANELYAFFANNVKSYREGALPQKIESIITNRKQYEDENWSISDALMRYYGK